MELAQVKNENQNQESKMNKFESWLKTLNEGVQLTHLEHIEDLLIIDGKEGLKTAIEFLKSNLDVLHGSSNLTIQGKMDGAPAIIAGIDPENGKFFVATKSLFNKVPKINYTEEDIAANHEGGVSDKLKIALAELPKLGIKGIIQGDMLFDRSILKKEKINGEEYITFRPNTITYAVPADSELASKILRAKIGMAWHTTYTGTSITDLSASFKIDISTHKSTPAVFDTDTNLKIENPLISDAEYQDMLSVITKIESDGNKFNDDDLDYISKYKNDILAYINSKVKEGSTVSDSMVKGLFDYINSKFEKEKAKLKTPKGIEGKEAQKKEMSNDIRKVAGTLWFVLKTHQQIQEIKSAIISKLDNISKMSTFIETDSGYKVTTPEGYVAIDKLEGGAVKLVDRLEFSKNNFNIMKNWN